MDFFANAMADAAADIAALLAEIPRSAAAKVTNIDNKVAQVHNRMIAVATLTWAKRPPPSREPRPTQKARQEAYRQALGKTTHDIVKNAAAKRKRLTCRRCLGSCQPQTATQWLETRCMGIRRAEGTHGSHCLDYFRGILFCITCGVYTASGHRKYHLKRFCPGRPTRSGKALLAAIKERRLPPNFWEWPEAE